MSGRNSQRTAALKLGKQLRGSSPGNVLPFATVRSDIIVGSCTPETPTWKSACPYPVVGAPSVPVNDLCLLGYYIVAFRFQYIVNGIIEGVYTQSQHAPQQDPLSCIVFVCHSVCIV